MCLFKPLATEEDEKIGEKNENTNQINENWVFFDVHTDDNGLFSRFLFKCYQIRKSWVFEQSNLVLFCFLVSTPFRRRESTRHGLRESAESIRWYKTSGLTQFDEESPYYRHTKTNRHYDVPKLNERAILLANETCSPHFFVLGNGAWNYIKGH